VKNDRNASRMGYLWPDRDNTILAFKYSEDNIIEPSDNLLPDTVLMATNTIDLMGLQRTPHSNDEPTDRDSRWIARIRTWGVIEDSFRDWLSCPTPEMARQIARTALGHGFYSFWLKKFDNIPEVNDAIKQIFPNTYHPLRTQANTLIIRSNGGVF
jgi:hypothetical protein